MASQVIPLTNEMIVLAIDGLAVTVNNLLPLHATFAKMILTY